MNYNMTQEVEVEDLVEEEEQEDWKIRCDDDFTCTDLTDQPGASIVSPVVLCLSGVIGQVWALYYLYTLKRPQHSRTVFFTLLSTLIWTDLVGKLLTTAPAVAAYVNEGWLGGRSTCMAHGFVMALVSLSTHLLVSTMAVERLLGTTQTYFYNKNITATRTKVLLASLLGGATTFCCLPFFGIGRYQLQYPGSWCYLDFHVTSSFFFSYSSSYVFPSSNSSSSFSHNVSSSSSSNFSASFSVSPSSVLSPNTSSSSFSSSPLQHLIFTNFFGVVSVACLLVMVACNLVVMWVLVEKNLARRGKCEATVQCLRRCRGQRFRKHLVAPRRSSSHQELETQMVVVLLVITVVFVLSWSPIDVRLFLNQLWPHRTKEDHMKDLVAVRFSSINQIVDPWAYIISRKVFRPSALRWVRSSVLSSLLAGRDRSRRGAAGDGSPKHPSPSGEGSGRRGQVLRGTPVVMAALTIGELAQAPLLSTTTTTSGVELRNPATCPPCGDLRGGDVSLAIKRF
ncbi:prostaglandin E2 receptor EP4 subtype-like [Portunus trituberculatus]|uniref:prostaglandin E2 receptor EP4 subtype-like n=1 Tax=Portunus trituberculatus TaxID=210409 RepID=UPI001E1CCBFF|nr:prostaglandin E2 receptor EP4 subtype-like [Portunus trituberculatus]